VVRVKSFLIGEFEGDTMTEAQPLKVLVAVDGSEQALEAVRYVSKILPPDKLEVVLFHVQIKFPESFWDKDQASNYNYRIVDIRAWEQQQQKAVDDFMEVARRIVLDAGVPDRLVTVRIEPRKSGVVDDIAEEAQSGYGAVVLGRRGLSELKDLVLGSTCYKLLERLNRVPLCVVGGRPRPGKILLCLDLSEGAIETAGVAGDLFSKNKDVQVTIFHAIRGMSLFRQLFGAPFTQEHERSLVESVEKGEREPLNELEVFLNRAGARLQQMGISSDRVTTRIVKDVSSRAGAIVEEADKEGIDTLIVGRRGLSKVQELFLGRVSNKVIQLAKDKAVWIVN
jgi:nucleotide-binding universal stress UspA family protein